MSRGNMLPPRPGPDTVPELVQLYKDAKSNGFEAQANWYLKALALGTADYKRLFDFHPPEAHPVLWDALYIAKNDHWSHDLPNTALIDTMENYRNMFYGTDPPFHLLRPWVGHGFGYQGVHQAPEQPAAGPGRRKRALVPGYGKGADAVFLAKICGYEVVGLDISPTALTMAQKLTAVVDFALSKYLAQIHIEDRDLVVWVELAAAAEERWGVDDINAGPITWLMGDFLSDDCLKGDEKFDLIFDNYFFSALHPSLRPKWALKVNDLLARPKGKLLCREFPSYRDVRFGGPPYSAGCWFYQLHLTHPGNEKVVDYVQGVIDLSPETTSTSGSSLAQIARFLATDMDETEAYELETWMSIWGPALGGKRPKAQEVTKADEPSKIFIEPRVEGGKRKLILKRRKAQHDLRRDSLLDDSSSLANSADSASSKSMSSPEEEWEGIYDCEPEVKVVKRVKFSIPSP